MCAKCQCAHVSDKLEASAGDSRSERCSVVPFCLAVLICVPFQQARVDKFSLLILLCGHDCRQGQDQGSGEHC